jgi:hypothetical protein
MADEVQELIKRSRAKGGFGKKGFFRLAHDKAKTKIGEYALPSPVYYCLELVQAGVAAGAGYIDVLSEDSRAIVTIAGASFDRKDMEMLFDFILSAREEPAYRARRRLAIGVAAALSLPTPAFKGDEAKVVIESGDGTLEGSVRLELVDLSRDAVIGQPKTAVKGTFVKVRRSGWDEAAILEERCLNIPIPLCLNGNIVTGMGGKRSLRIAGFGYKHGVMIDEGDFYGGLVFDVNYPKRTAEIKILTGGVWITSIGFPELPTGIVGMVNFDWLRKTANQYEIVRDERLGALVERLKPYVDRIQVKLGKSDKERLRFLCHRAPYDIFTGFNPYSLEIDGLPRVGDATLVVHYDGDGLPDMKIYAEWTSKLVDSVTIPFDIPANARLLLRTLSIDCLWLRSLGSEPYDSNYVVGLLPEIYEGVKAAIEAEGAAIRKRLLHMKNAHDERAAWQRKEDEVSAEAAENEKEPEEQEEKEESPEGEQKAPMTLKEIMDRKAELERNAEAVLTTLEKLEGHRPTPSAPAAPAVTAPLTTADVASMLEGARKQELRLHALPPLLGRILASALGFDFVTTVDDEKCRRKFRFMKLDPSVMVMGKAVHDLFPGPVSARGESFFMRDGFSMELLPDLTLNLANPVIGRLLADLDAHPESLYAMAAVMLREIDRMAGFRLVPQTQRLHDIILKSVTG